jgi:hypothetical protein
MCRSSMEMRGFSERFQETLAAGIVIGVRRPTHARDHLVLF